METSRRQLLLGSSLGASALVGQSLLHRSPITEEERVGPTHAIIPVVGDGKWIATEPPEAERGYFEPREFDLTVEIRVRGNGTATNLSAFTVAPVAFPEQEILEFRVKQHGCRASLQQLTATAARLCLQADSIRAGQTLAAIAQYRLKISKSYFAYEPSMFPENQELSREAGRYLGNSPGIQTNSKQVREVVRDIVTESEHPLIKAQAFQSWVWENIKGRLQDYTNVVTALRRRVGDCEERAAVFVALCRASGIPARLVWIPNHNWAEILLADEAGEEHWIPCHTAAYSWFGWTGVHELVLQKGDRIQLPGRNPVRLVYDNLRYSGRRPDVFFTADLTPVAESAEDAGPGARQKQPNGQWKLVGQHQAQRLMRA